MDVKTLFYLFAISNVFIGLLLLVFNYKNKNQKEITFIYSSGKFIVAIFWVAFAYREQWSIYITYVFANVLALTVLCLELYCFYFVGRKPNYKVLLRNLLFILLVSSSLFFFIDSTPAVKVVHMSVVFIGLYLVGGLVLIFNHRGFTTLKIVAIMSLAMCFTFIAKFFIPPNSSGLLSPNYIIVFSYISSYLLGFCWTILYFDVLNQIAQKEILLKNEEIELDNKKLKELNATKAKLFSIIAHDLRNPIQAIIQLGQMVSGKLGPLSDADKAEAIQAITKSANTTNNLLSNLLQWGRSETGKLAIQRDQIYLRQLVADCEEVLSETLIQKIIHFENRIEGDVYATADYNMISTVLRNLISNAAKFTNEGGSIIVSCSVMNSTARIQVTDTGVGIPSNVLQKLFDTQFQFYTKGTNNEPGTGLGLKLCKEFIEQNGGTIGAESVESKGSTFYFTLPLKA
jgi:signal transduction histidine kinase